MSSSKEAKIFERSLSHLLKRSVQYSAFLYMNAVGQSGLTQRQLTVLTAVDTIEGKSQNELVKLTGIDRSTLADLVSRLVEQGYLQRRKSKDDARANLVRLTSVGKKALRGSQNGAEEIDRKLLSHFGAAERRVVMDCLGRLSSELDKVENNSKARR